SITNAWLHAACSVQWLITVCDPRAKVKEMSNVTTERQAPESKAPVKLKRQFVSFACFKVDPAWRRIAKEERQKGKEEFEAVVDKYVADKTCQILSYTLMGTRADVDLMLWVIAYELEPIQQLATDLAKTGLGTYMTRPYSFLAMTKRSMYLDRL